jgi:hypothetical protein
MAFFKILSTRLLSIGAPGSRRKRGGEVLTLEPAALNLFGEQPIDRRVVDVLEKVTVDPLVDGSHDPVRIDEQDGDSWPARRLSGSRNSGLDTTTDRRAAAPANELVRK